jgi:hypothetical protein
LLVIGKDANASKEALFEFIAQKLQGFEVILVDDPQPTHIAQDFRVLVLAPSTLKRVHLSWTTLWFPQTHRFGDYGIT